MNHPRTTRRNFLSGVTAGAGLLLTGCNRGGGSGESAPAGGSTPGGPADVTLRIAPVLADAMAMLEASSRVA